MNPFVRTLLFSSLGISTALASGLAHAESACEEAQEPAAEAPPGSEGHAHHHHGFMHLVGEALEKLDLSAEQKSEIKVLGDLVKERSTEVHRARHELAGALADQFAAGKVDRSALEPVIAAFATAAAKASPVKHSAFEELHRILTPEQRAKFVDELKSEAKEHAEAHAEHHGAMAQKWAADLGLTDDQKEKFKAVFDEYAPVVKAHREVFGRVLDAFKEESFSVDAVVPGFDAGAHARAMANVAIELTEKAIDILTPEQRAAAAAKIHEVLAKHGAHATAACSAGATPSEHVHTSQEAAPLIVGSGYPAAAVFPGGSFGYSTPGYAWSTPLYGPGGAGISYGAVNPGYSYGYSVPGASGYSSSSGYTQGYSYDSSLGFPVVW